jgi:hypothetical protein
VRTLLLAIAQVWFADEFTGAGLADVVLDDALRHLGNAFPARSSAPTAPT